LKIKLTKFGFIMKINFKKYIIFVLSFLGGILSYVDKTYANPYKQGFFTFKLEAFGARCDGKTDDTQAITHWLSAGNSRGNSILIARPGRCIFTRALFFPSGGASNVSLRGAGPYSTVFVYAGKANDIDLLTIGDGRSAYTQFSIGDFSLTSITPMIAGSALHLRGLQRSLVSNIIIDGQEGAGNFWNGIWFDGIDSIVTSGQNYATAKRDAVRVNGIKNLGMADLTLSGWKISPPNGQVPNKNQIGLHIGGGFGGLYCTGGTDIIGNGTNVVIDKKLNLSLPNREAAFDGMCAIDSSAYGPGLALNEVGGNNYLSFSGSWIASSHTDGIYITRGATGWISYTGGTIYNNGRDGVHDESGSVLLSYSGTIFRHNGQSGSGVGIYSVKSNNLVHLQVRFDANASGDTATLP